MISHSSSRVNWSSAPNGSSSRSSVRIVNQRPAQRSPLLHAAGQLPGKFRAETGEADARKRGLDAVAILGFALFRECLLEGRHDLERQHDVVADVQPRQQGRVLERHADPHMVGADLAAGDEHMALRGIQRSRDQLEDRRLAAAGRTDQRDELAMRDAQGGLRQRRDLVLAARRR